MPEEFVALMQTRSKESLNYNKDYSSRKKFEVHCKIRMSSNRQ